MLVSSGRKDRTTNLWHAAAMVAAATFVGAGIGLAVFSFQLIDKPGPAKPIAKARVRDLPESLTPAAFAESPAPTPGENDFQSPRPPSLSRDNVARGEARTGPLARHVGTAKAPPRVAARFVASDKPLTMAGINPEPRYDPRVNAAIYRGAAFLKRSLTVDTLLAGNDAFAGLSLSLDRNNPFVGISVANPGVPPLLGLTLLECGVPANDPIVQRAATLTRQAVPGLSNCYGLSTAILFLDRLGEAKDEYLIRAMALNLIAGQGKNGIWGYNCMPLTPRDQELWLKYLRNPNLPAPMNSLAAWSQPAIVAADEGPDCSNTQFVVLALWAARKHDIPVARPLALVEAYFRATQLSDGSWTYRRRQAPRHGWRHPSTTAGLLGIAAGRGAADIKSGRSLLEDPAVAQGLRFVGQIVGKYAQPNSGGSYNNTTGKIFNSDSRGDIYFLWSLERVAMIYNLRTIENKDWYAWGVTNLLANQQVDGSWREWYPVIPDTCFALLFLKRTNVVKDLTLKLQTIGSIKTSAPASYEEKVRTLGTIKEMGSIKERGPNR